MFNTMRLGLGLSGDGGGSALSNWFSSPLSGKTIRFDGDSTWAGFTTLFTELSAFTTKPGEMLAGVTATNAGNSGATLASYLDGSTTNDITDTIAATPSLVMLRYGINDVRNGGGGGDTVASLTATLRANLISAVDQLRAALPTTDIALCIPNSLLSSDPGGTGYLATANAFAGMTLAQAAQAATDIMWNAYKSLERRWPNVIVIDLQTDIYGRTCQPTSALMTDILHPVNTGPHGVAFAAYLANIIGYRAPFDAVASAAAWAANPGNPLGACAVYSRALEDTNFMTKRFTARWSAQGSGSFIDYAHLPTTDTQKLDYIQQAYGLGNFQILNSAGIGSNGANTRVFSLSVGQPPYAQTGGSVQVFRAV